GNFRPVHLFRPSDRPHAFRGDREHFPWQTLFMMMLPIAMIDMIIAYFILDNVTERTNPRLDSLSIVLSSLAFGGMLFGFGNAGNTGWISYEVLVSLSIDVVTLGICISRELSLKGPLL